MQGNTLRSRFFIGGNWKANGTKASIVELVEGLNKGQEGIPMNVEAVCAPPFIYLSQVAESLNPRYGASQKASSARH